MLEKSCEIKEPNYNKLMPTKVLLNMVELIFVPFYVSLENSVRGWTKTCLSTTGRLMKGTETGRRYCHLSMKGLMAMMMKS